MVCTVKHLSGPVLRDPGPFSGFCLSLQCCSEQGGHARMIPFGPWYQAGVLVLSCLSFPFPSLYPGSLEDPLLALASVIQPPEPLNYYLSGEDTNSCQLLPSGLSQGLRSYLLSTLHSLNNCQYINIKCFQFQQSFGCLSGRSEGPFKITVSV